MKNTPPSRRGRGLFWQRLGPTAGLCLGTMLLGLPTDGPAQEALPVPPLPPLPPTETRTPAAPAPTGNSAPVAPGIDTGGAATGAPAPQIMTPAPPDTAAPGSAPALPSAGGGDTPAPAPPPGAVQGAADVPGLPMLVPGPGSLPGGGEPLAPAEKQAILEELQQLGNMAVQLQNRISALTKRLEGSGQLAPAPAPLPEQPGGLASATDLMPGSGAAGAPAAAGGSGAPGGGAAAPGGAAAAAGGSAAGAAAGEAPKLADLKYNIAKFDLQYMPPEAQGNKELPPIEKLTEVKVQLGPQGAAYGKPREGKAAKYTKNFNGPILALDQEHLYDGEALQVIYTALTKEMNRRGFYGVLVTPDPADIDVTTGEDLRAGRKPLKVFVYTSVVKEVRTVSKQVKPGENAVDTAPLKWVAKGSPLQKGDLLKKSALQDYLTGLNRFPGRRVDAAINSSGEPGGIVLDYIVRQEQQPLHAFLQASNTGTESTGDWRLRLGMEYRNLIGHDDILNGDFITSPDAESISILGSYQRAILAPDKLKVRLYGSYGKFTASDVGFDLQNFHGDSYTAGIAFTITPFKIKGVPIDAFIGAEWKYVSVENETFPQSGASDFFVPYAGIGFAQATDRYAYSGSAQFEFNLPRVAGTKQSDIDRLGRFNTTPDFKVAKWSFAASTFLEPIVFGNAWKEGKVWWKSTLAHEVAFSAHGQYTFENGRLVPQFEDVIGGLTTVRGYPEAITAGDTTVVGSAEYRLHLPRLLKPADKIAQDKAGPGATPADLPPPKFAWIPNTVGSAYGRPDWDLIVRGFIDGGLTYNNNLIASAERDEKLLGVGVGLELQITKYLNLRADYGIALLPEKDFVTNPVEKGDGRFHFIFSLLW